MTFTEEELEITQAALGVRFCLLETGQPHIGASDVARMDEASRKAMGVRPPTLAQITEAMRARAVWERILKRNF